MGKKLTTKKSTIYLERDTVTKAYNLDYPYRNTSSIENELYCMNKFSMNGRNPYAPKVLKERGRSFTMPRYRICIGKSARVVNEKNISRILFSITLEELNHQFDEMADMFEKLEINHKDLHPSNIMFDEKDRHFKIIDFFWSTADHVNPVPPYPLNIIFGENDRNALKKIKSKIKKHCIALDIEGKIKHLKDITKKFGVKYYDGSASCPGKTYHRIDIPYFKDHEFHKNVDPDFERIMDSLTIVPRTAIDVGCAAGFNTFNLIRNFIMNKMTAYEADPHMFEFLTEVKNTFKIKELEIIDRITPDTKIPSVDVTVCMNVHMWLVKQFGRSGANRIVSNLIKNSKEMFFQTAHRGSYGKYKVKWLRDKNDIKKYLEELGGRNVELIGTRRRRHMFKIK